MAYDEVLNSSQVASLMGMSVSWVYLHVREDSNPRLPHLRLGRAVRFRRSEIDRFLNGRYQPCGYAEAPELEARDLAAVSGAR
jgi:excisionase family DNA binding protein